MATTLSTPAIVTDGNLAANVASYARHLRAANLAPATQRAYLDALRQLSDLLTRAGMPTDVAAITREHVKAFISDQLARLAPASAANRYSSLRSVSRRYIVATRPCATGEFQPTGGHARRYIYSLLVLIRDHPVYQAEVAKLRGYSDADLLGRLEKFLGSYSDHDDDCPGLAGRAYGREDELAICECGHVFQWELMAELRTRLERSGPPNP